MREMVAKVHYVTNPYLMRRHDLLADVIQTKAAMSAHEFDHCLIRNRTEFGPLWDQLGRGFWLPEIEWWR